MLRKRDYEFNDGIDWRPSHTVEARRQATGDLQIPDYYVPPHLTLDKAQNGTPPLSLGRAARENPEKVFRDLLAKLGEEIHKAYGKPGMVIYSRDGVELEGIERQRALSRFHYNLSGPRSTAELISKEYEGLLNEAFAFARQIQWPHLQQVTGLLEVLRNPPRKKSLFESLVAPFGVFRRSESPGAEWKKANATPNTEIRWKKR